MLLTYSDSHSGSYELRQIHLERMMLEADHINLLSSNIPGLYIKSKDLFCLYGILAISLIRAFASEQENGIRMLGFHLVELLHRHRVLQIIFLCCHKQKELKFQTT